MPCVAAYVTGVRLSQSLIISDPARELQLPRQELLLSLDRLEVCINELLTVFPICGDDGSRLCNLVSRCWRSVEGLSLEHVQLDGEDYRPCHSELEIIRKLIERLLQPVPPLATWFALGGEIAHGEWTDPIHSMSGQRVRDGDARWEPHNGDLVEELLGKLNISTDLLLVEPGVNWDGVDLPDYLMIGWTQIEAGMLQLTARRSEIVVVLESLNQLGTDVSSEELVTLDQMALLVQKDKKTLQNKKIGAALFEVRPSCFRWREARELLLKTWPGQAHRLPESYPAAMALLRGDQSVQPGI